MILMQMMKTTAVTFAFLLGAFSVRAQTYYEYKWIFNGTAYQTNGAGNIVGTPITDQTLLQTEAQLLNITNLGTVSLVYHLEGSYPLWDTVELISNANCETLTTLFGLYYGSQYAGETNAAGQPTNTLGRYAVTNATQLEQRRVDQVYTFNDTLYTYDNSGSLGASFTCKRFLVDTSGDTNMFIDGTLFWDVIPTGTNVAPILCAGHFTLGQPIPGAAIPPTGGD
jgi:hypothetical protein